MVVIIQPPDKLQHISSNNLLPSSHGVVRGVLLVRGVGGGQVGGHAGQRLQGRVGGRHRSSPIRFLVSKYTVRQAVHLTISWKMKVFLDFQANISEAKHCRAFVLWRLEFQFWSWRSSRQTLLNTFTARRSWWSFSQLKCCLQFSPLTLTFWCWSFPLV